MFSATEPVYSITGRTGENEFIRPFCPGVLAAYNEYGRLLWFQFTGEYVPEECWGLIHEVFDAESIIDTSGDDTGFDYDHIPR